MKIILKYIIIKILFYSLRIFGKKANHLKFERVLVIAPHPDDEILGFGGTMLRLIESGTRIYILYLTDGENSGVWADSEEIKIQRILISQKVCKSLGIDNTNITRLHLPDGAVPTSKENGYDEVVKSIRDIITTFAPDAVFATHPLDYWPLDHVACSKIAYSAVKQSGCKCQLWYYWVWAWYNLESGFFLNLRFRKLNMTDITHHLEQKKALSNVYLQSLTPDGLPWCGILPSMLLKTSNFNFEVIERIKL